MVNVEYYSVLSEQHNKIELSENILKTGSLAFNLQFTEEPVTHVSQTETQHK